MLLSTSCAQQTPTTDDSQAQEQKRREAKLLGYLVAPQKPRLKGDDYPDVVEYAVAVTQSLNSCAANIRSARRLYVPELDSDAPRGSGNGGAGKGRPGERGGPSGRGNPGRR